MNKKVELQSVLCTLETTATVSVEVRFLNGTLVDWLTVDVTDGTIEGVAPEVDQRYELRLAVGMNNTSAEYDFVLFVQACTDD